MYPAKIQILTIKGLKWQICWEQKEEKKKKEAECLIPRKLVLTETWLVTWMGPGCERKGNLFHALLVKSHSEISRSKTRLSRMCRALLVKEV